jgi:hypothetical protein
VSDQVRVTIQKAPEVFAGTDKVICEGESALIADATIGGSATSVTWSGGSGSYSPNATTLNATYTPTSGEVGTTVALTITTNSIGPCSAVSDQVNVTINQAPTVVAGMYAPICIGDTVQLNGAIGGSASSATWTGGSGTFINPTQLDARYVPSASEDGANVVLILSTDDPVGVCTARISQTTVKVNSLPSPAFFNLDVAYQLDDPSENLIGLPSPGVFSGNGIVGSTFIPAVADTGTHVIRYTHTDANGCTNFAEKSTVVFALPEAEVGNPGPYCLGVNPLNNALPRTSNPDFSDSWSGNNVFAGGGEFYFNNEAAGVGLHEVIYTVVDNNTGAVTNEPRFIVVNDVPKIDFTTTNNCVADTIHFLDLTRLDSANVFGDMITSWMWEIGVGPDYTSSVQNPDIKFDNTKPDTYFVTLTAYTKYNCSASGNKEIEIGAIPDPDFIVSNLTYGEQSTFTDITQIPNQGFPSGYTDPTASIITIWWDFEEAQQSGSYNTLNTAYHQFSQSNREYDVTMTIETNLGCTASIMHQVSIIESISSFPYLKDFDDPNENTSAFRGENPSWQLKIPNGLIIQGDNKAWVTGNVDNRHNDNENSFVALPAFDLRPLTRPMLSIDIWSNAESTRDGAALQYSFDGGQWQTMVDPDFSALVNYPIGQIGLNWYNEKGLVSRPGEGMIDGTVGENEGSFGWTGVYSEWKTARFPLDEIRNTLIQNSHASVRFRVVFSSDQENPEGTTYDGFAFDNLWLGDRTHNVLLEHFDNLSIGNQINLINSISDKFALDLIPLQYHTKYPSEDEIYRNNKFPVETRGSIFDINQSPRSFMDGIKEYDFTGSLINDYQIINRSLIDPLFDITVDIVPTGNENDVNLNVTLMANDTLNEEVTAYVIPIETSIRGLDALASLNIDSLNNIAKDMLPSGGRLIDLNWQAGISNAFEVNWDLNKLNKGNEIYDATNLGVVVFVQNAVNQGSREIYQAVYAKLPVLKKTLVTGLEDELNIKKIQDASIYPNPANNYFNVALSSELTQDMDWVIVDQRGVELLRGKFVSGEDTYEVDAKDLPNGLHMMIVSANDDSNVVRKVIISR